MRFALLTLFVLLLCSLTVGCGGGSSGDPLGGQPNLPGKAGLRIYVTDAPFPGDLVESASVVINEVRVRDKSEGGWVVVFEGSEEIDLVPLSGGVSSLLVDVDLAPGVYDEVRLLVDAGQVVLKPEAVVADDSYVFNSENGGLHFPSGAQTGIKVKVDNEITVVTELTSDLTLDFDLSKNFVFNGPPTHAPGVRRVIFTPVVRAVNSSTAGSVEMAVWSDNATPNDTEDDFLLEGAGVQAKDDQGADAGGGMTDANGFFSLQLPGGTYTIEIEMTGHDPASVADVQVAAANLVRLDPILLAASAGEVRGTIFSDGGTDGETGDDLVLAVAAVSATLQGELDPAATTETDNQGAFSFSELAPGMYDLAVTKAGFEDGLSMDVIPTSAGTVVVLTLKALKENLTGTVTDAAGDPIQDVDVVVTNVANDEVAATTTDEFGVYAVLLGTGSYKVTFTDPATENTTTVDVTIDGANPVTDEVLDQQL